MTALDLARAQFATTTALHWMFVMVTLGLVVVIAILQTRATMSQNPVNRELLMRMARFWGLIYVINYAVGIASGILMEFQFGMNWSGLNHVVGDVFGAPLAVETLVAFVAESTFLALWVFGWGKLHKYLHLALIWLVALTAYLSAFWVLIANAFLQDPTGYELVDGRANLTDVGALIANPNAIVAFVHVTGAAMAAGGVVLVVISSFHLFRRTQDRSFHVRSFRFGYLYGLVGLVIAWGSGWIQYVIVSDKQPAKTFDAMLDQGDRDAISAQLIEQFGPGDWVATGGLAPVFLTMTTIADMFVPLMFLMVPIVFGALPARMWWFMPLFWFAMPWPFIAAICGWVFREMGRQPWLVYGIQTTADAVSDISIGYMWASFITFSSILVALLIVNWWLIARNAIKGGSREIFGITPHDNTTITPVTTGKSA